MPLSRCISLKYPTGVSVSVSKILIYIIVCIWRFSSSSRAPSVPENEADNGEDYLYRKK